MRVLSIRGSGGTAGTVVGGLAGLRKCALMNEGRGRGERDGKRR